MQARLGLGSDLIPNPHPNPNPGPNPNPSPSPNPNPNPNLCRHERLGPGGRRKVLEALLGAPEVPTRTLP